MKKKSIYFIILAFFALLYPIVSSAEETSVPLEQIPGVDILSIDLTQKDIKTTQKIEAPGATVAGSLVLSVPAKKLVEPTSLVIKRRDSVMYPIPEGKTMVSEFWEVDVTNKAAFVAGKSYFIAEVPFADIGSFREVYFWDGQKWQDQTSLVVNHKKNTIQVKITSPYVRFLILGDDSVMVQGTASWYNYKKCNCAASPDYPKGSILRVTSLVNNKSVEVKVNDYGPDRSIVPGRVIDLDVVAFKKIGSKSDGLIPVKVELVSQL